MNKISYQHELVQLYTKISRFTRYISTSSLKASCLLVLWDFCFLWCLSNADR